MQPFFPKTRPVVCDLTVLPISYTWSGTDNKSVLSFMAEVSAVKSETSESLSVLCVLTCIDMYVDMLTLVVALGIDIYIVSI